MLMMMMMMTMMHIMARWLERVPLLSLSSLFRHIYKSCNNGTYNANNLRVNIQVRVRERERQKENIQGAGASIAQFFFTSDAT